MARKNHKQTERARQLRKDSTQAEDKIWQEIRGRRLGGYKFKRQVPIGRYIVDFYCSDAKLIIELDGDSHAGRENQDAVRDAYFSRDGIKTVRIDNSDVYDDIDGVLDVLWAHLEKRHML